MRVLKLMDRNLWPIIWQVYRTQANWKAFARAMWRNSTGEDRCIVGVLFVLFLGAGVTWWVLRYQSIMYVMGGAELLLLWRLDSLKRRSFSAYAFAGDSFHRSARFSLFVEGLKRESVTNVIAKRYLDVVKHEIDLVETEPFYARRIVTLMTGIGLLVIATMLREIAGLELPISPLDWFAVFVVAVGVFLFLYVLLLPFRSHVEMLKELQLYLSVYSAQDDGRKRWAKQTSHVRGRTLRAPHELLP